MKRKSAEQQAKGKGKKPSPFFKPKKVGDRLEGNFVQFEATQFGIAMRLTKGLVAVNKILLRLLKATDYKKFNEKTKVKVVFIGLGKGKKGKPSHLYELHVNGKKIDAPFSEPLDEKKLDKFFA